MRSALLLAFLVISVSVLAGCTGIGEEQARATALEFVKSRVKFYSADQSYTVSSEKYDYVFGKGSLEAGTWVFFVNASYTRLNETKKASIRLAVDSRTGQVVAFEQIR